MNNVLILSAGRRVGLVNCFKKSALLIDEKIKIYCADSDPSLSSACAVADNSFVLPHFNDQSFRQSLFDLCEKFDITLIIPTIDTGLEVLSSIQEEMRERGCEIVICTKELIDYFNDKRKSSEFFKEYGIDTPAIYSSESLEYPCFCKPYNGSLSAGAMRLDDEYSLTPQILSNHDNMFMEYIPHAEYDEYTVDLYFDRIGQLKCVVPRRRLEVRGGEVSKGLTGNDHVVEYLFSKIKRVHGARGVLTLQLFYRSIDHDIKAIEVNPRFGGGYPLTDASGATYASWLIKEYISDEDLKYFDGWKRDLLMLRYDEQVLIDGYTAK